MNPSQNNESQIHSTVTVDKHTAKNLRSTASPNPREGVLVAGKQLIPRKPWMVENSQENLSTLEFEAIEGGSIKFDTPESSRKNS
jgi:hypothetical protein